MMRNALVSSIVLVLSIAAAMSLPAHAASTDTNRHPDLTGVWAAFVEPGKSAFVSGEPEADLPLTPDGKAKLDAYQKLVAPTGDGPGAHCLGYGMPTAMVFSGIYPMEIIQRADQITIIYEAHSEIRRLYFGSKIIPAADRLTGRDGYSTARWQGATLIVDTGSLKEQEDSMFPHSDQAHITETYHVDTDAKGTRVLVADWTLTDPAFYTKPVTRQKKWTFDPKGILLPYECNEEAWLDHLDELRGKTPVDKSYK